MGKNIAPFFLMIILYPFPKQWVYSIDLMVKEDVPVYIINIINVKVMRIKDPTAHVCLFR